jgi:hypothetical protein
MPEALHKQTTALRRLDPGARHADPDGWLEPFRYMLPSDMEAAVDNMPGLPERVRREVTAAVQRGRAAIERDARLRHIEGTYLLYDRQTDIRQDLDDFSAVLGDVRTPDRAMDLSAAQARRKVTDAYDRLRMVKDRIDQLAQDREYNESLLVDPEASLRTIIDRYDVPRPDFTREDAHGLRTTTERPESPARLDLAGLNKKFNVIYSEWERTEDHVTQMEDRDKRVRGGQQSDDQEIATKYKIPGRVEPG